MQARVLSAQSVASGATATADLDTRRLGQLVLSYKLAGTTTPGDLTVNDPVIYAADGQLGTVALAPKTTVAPASDGANVVALRTYDLGGVERVRVSAKNTNVAALLLTVDVYGEFGGRV